MTKIRNYSAVIFDKTTCATSEVYEKYYKKNFEGKTFIFLGEIPNVPGHCLLADLHTGQVSGMHHTDNFREATENEV